MKIAFVLASIAVVAIVMLYSKAPPIPDGECRSRRRRVNARIGRGHRLAEIVVMIGGSAGIGLETIHPYGKSLAQAPAEED